MESKGKSLTIRDDRQVRLVICERTNVIPSCKRTALSEGERFDSRLEVELNGSSSSSVRVGSILQKLLASLLPSNDSTYITGKLLELVNECQIYP